MNNEEKLKQLRETIELAQKQIEALEKPKFDVCRNGYYVSVIGEVCSTSGYKRNASAEDRAEFFKTAEIAVKVDKILEPSRFIAQYVFEHAPDYVPDFDDVAVARWYVHFKNGVYSHYFNNDLQTLGVVYMPKNIAIDLCELLNSGDYKLTSDNNE